MTTETSNARGETYTFDMIEDAWGDAVPLTKPYFNRFRARLETLRQSAAPPPAAARGDVRGLVDVVSDLRHSAVMDDYEIDQIAFISSIADRIESALAAEGVQAGEVDQRAPSYEALSQPAEAQAQGGGEVSFDRRFADMLIGILGDVQDELGFTEEDKLCANGSAEIVAAIRELKERAITAPPSAPVGVEGRYHPCTHILIDGLKRLEGGTAVLAEWDRARAQADAALAQQPAAVAVDKARFKRAPCYLCGYNGPGYYQPDTHPCAAKYHATQHQEPTT